MGNKIEDVLAVLDNVKRQGKNYTASCPAHDDKNPSFSVSEKDGRIIMNCFAGCSQEQIADALAAKGVFLNERKQEYQYSPIPDDGKNEPDFEGLLHYRPSAVWRYLDAEGYLLGFVCRIDEDGKPKSFRPVTPWKNEEFKIVWRKKSFPSPAPLYGLDLLAQHHKKPVLVVEGEKAADAARDMGVFKDYVVVTWPGGANRQKQADWTPLKGREVVIWPDNDDAGKNAAREIAKILKEIK
ncbi:MAG: CHC2 zinc finger domain-containing protein [Alphaproteobacteria bacterium]